MQIAWLVWIIKTTLLILIGLTAIIVSLVALTFAAMWIPMPGWLAWTLAGSAAIVTMIVSLKWMDRK